MRVRAYFDGFNFYKGACEVAKVHEDSTGQALTWRWTDIRHLCANVAERYWGAVTVDYVAYCTSEVKRTYPGDTRRDRQINYLEALEMIGVDVVKGTFSINEDYRRVVSPKEGCPKWVRVRLPTEKGSDVNLATRLLRDFFTRQDEFDASLVVSDDYDLWDPVETLRGSGWPVGVVNPHGERQKITLWRDGLDGRHFGHRITPADLASAPLPLTVSGLLDGAPASRSCPREWIAPE